MEIGYEIGLVPQDRYDKFLEKKKRIEDELVRLRSLMIKPNEETQALIRSVEGSELKDGIRAADLLKRTEMNYDLVVQLAPSEV